MSGRHCRIKNVCLGVYVHGLAGDIAAEELGKISMTATDIIGNIYKALEIIIK